MKKRKIPRYEDLTTEEYQAFTDELKNELMQLKEENEALQVDIAEHELRMAYLDKIKEQNTLFSGNKNLL